MLRIDIVSETFCDQGASEYRLRVLSQLYSSGSFVIEAFCQVLHDLTTMT
jgi:hypothetical protein